MSLRPAAQMHEYTPCCGIDFLQGSPAVAEIEAVRRRVSKKHQSVRQMVPPQTQFHGPRGLLLATTTAHEHGYEQSLRTAGFVMVKEFKNPNTRRMVKLWVGEAAPRKREKNAQTT